MKRRHAFTLVELMVSMALIIFIMAILSQAFIAALGTFRNLKAQGDLAEKLRATTQILQRDLAANHFDGNRRLSDPHFWDNGPPQQGFFRIWQNGPQPGTTPEGADINNIGSYRSTGHYLAFTVKLVGNDMGDFMSASAAGSGNGALSGIQTFGPPEARYQLTSGGAYNYQWAEVAWFLQPQINPTTGQPDMTAPDPTAINPATGLPPLPGVPLYTLYRRQRLLVPDNSLVALATGGGISNAPANFLEVSCWPSATGNLYFNNPTDITVPWRRFGMLPPNPTYLAYPAGLLFGAVLPFPYSNWLGSATPWPLVPPTTPPSPPPPWGSWVPPSATPPTYPPYPGIPPQIPTPSYPTLAQQGAPPTLIGSDIQLTDVISFDVRVYIVDPKTLLPLASNPNDPFVTLFSVPPTYQNNPAFYNQNTPPTNPTGPNLTAPAVFDTWTSIDDGIGTGYQGSPGPPPTNWASPFTLKSIPMWNSAINNGPIIKAIQITIRIWDFKTNQTRQVTIVQAM